MHKILGVRLNAAPGNELEKFRMFSTSDVLLSGDSLNLLIGKSAYSLQTSWV